MTDNIVLYTGDNKVNNVQDGVEVPRIIKPKFDVSVFDGIDIHSIPKEQLVALYIKAGYAPVPLGNPEFHNADKFQYAKRPIQNGWNEPPYQVDPAWWSSMGDGKEIPRCSASFPRYPSPRYNIGHLTGRVHRLGGVDLDVAKDGSGKHGMDYLVDHVGGAYNYREIFPPTDTRKSPTNSLHLVYELPDDLDLDLRNSASKLCSLVDFRGSGGMLVAPGSVTNKGVYVWEKRRNPVPMTEKAIKIFKDLVKPPRVYEVQGNTVPVDPSKWPPKPERIERAKKYIVKLPESIGGDGGSDRFFHAACVCVEFFALDAESAYEVLQVYSEKRCHPKWTDDDEVIHKIHDAILKIQPENHGKAYSGQKVDLSKTIFGDLYEESATDRSLLLAAAFFKKGNVSEICTDVIDRFPKGLLASDGCHLYVYDAKKGYWKVIEMESFKQSMFQYKQCINRSGDSLSVTAFDAQSIYDSVVSEVYQKGFHEIPRKGIATRNGFVTVIDKKKVLLPHSPENKATYFVDYDYTEDMKSPKIEKMLLDMLVDPNEIRVFLEFIGNGLLGDPKAAKGIMQIHGLPNTGKSTMVNLVKLLIAKDAIASTEPHKWHERFTMSGIYGKSALLCADVANKPIYGSEIKKISDGSTMEIEPKGKTAFHDQFSLLIILCTNHFLQVMEHGDAVHNRILHFETKMQYSKNGSDGIIPAVDDYHLTVKDEMGGFINLIVDGYVNYLQRGNFGDVSFSNRYKKTARNMSREEPVRRFFEDCVIASKDHRQSSLESFNIYQAWLKSNKEKCTDNTSDWVLKIMEEALRRNIQVVKYRPKIGGQKVTVFEGIKIAMPDEILGLRQTSDYAVDME